MLDKLRSMAVFARVAEYGSFRRAAQRVGLSPSVVSHHLSQLEKELGVQLLYRSTRHVALTEQGLRFYENCKAMLQAAEGALDSLHEDQLGGRLWLVAPLAFSAGPFIDDVAEFCELYPRAEVRLEFDDGPRNLIQEGIDLAIRFGPQESSALVCRRLFEHQQRFYASPTYLHKFGAIETIEALQAAQWVVLEPFSEPLLKGPQGQALRLSPRRRISANNVGVVHRLVLAGLGVAERAPHLVQQDVAAGRLIELLPHWHREDSPCYAIFPARAMPLALSRRFIEHLIGKMQAAGLNVFAQAAGESRRAD